MRATRRSATAAFGLVILLPVALRIFVDGSPVDAAFVATAQRSTLAVTLIESGVLRAAESVTYRSPLEGREVEVTYLAPEGAEVATGDLLAQLETAALRTELERAVQSLQQVEMELQAAGVEREEAALALRAVTEGAGALAIDEGRTELQLAQARALRLACPCAECVEEMTGRRLLDPTRVPAEVRPVALALVGGYGLRVHWSDGHSTGIYTFARLRADCPCPRCRPGALVPEGGGL